MLLAYVSYVIIRNGGSGGGGGMRAERAWRRSRTCAQWAFYDETFTTASPTFSLTPSLSREVNVVITRITVYKFTLPQRGEFNLYLLT